MNYSLKRLISLLILGAALICGTVYADHNKHQRQTQHQRQVQHQPQSAVQAQSAPSTGKLRLFYGKTPIDAEVARTNEEQQRGLMWRDKLPPNSGMLFIFAEETPHCMWMRNTLIPLAVAFIDQQSRIVNIEEMQALSEQVHCAQQPVRYALEMPAGWFSQHAQPGKQHRIDGLPKN